MLHEKSIDEVYPVVKIVYTDTGALVHIKVPPAEGNVGAETWSVYTSSEDLLARLRVLWDNPRDTLPPAPVVSVPLVEMGEEFENEQIGQLGFALNVE